MSSMIKKPPRLELEFITTHKDGSKSHVSYPVNSWVAAASGIMYALFDFTDTSVDDTGGTSRTIDVSPAGTHFLREHGVAPAGDDTNGIIVGTGSDAVDRDDIAVSGANEDDKIASGTGTGELEYQAVAVAGDVTAITGGYRFSITRAFDNNSGGTIVIREVAVYVQQSYSGATSSDFCIIRDLVSGGTGHSLADGESVVVRYNFNWTV